MYRLIIYSIMSILLHSQSKSEQINKLFTTWDETKPGGTVGIIKDGKLIYSKAYGLSDLSHGIKNTTRTAYRIASVSKQFTAASIHLLAEENKLNLSDPLRKYFPELKPYTEKITIQQILNHTSGLKDYLSLISYRGRYFDEYFSDSDVFKMISELHEPNFTPGSKYSYSNSGYYLLGKLVERVSGENLREYAEKKIFKPLGMKNTYYHNNRNQVVKNQATGYRLVNGKFEICMTTLSMIGDGGMISTLYDLTKWSNALSRKEHFSKSFWNTFTQTGKLSDGSSTSHASGLVISEHNGYKTISHGGSMVGYKCQFLHFPEEDLSIIIFTNRRGANPRGKSYEIADLFLKEKSKKKMKQESVKLDNTILNNYLGNYWNSIESYSVRIENKNDTLRYIYEDGFQRKLIPMNKNKFLMANSAVVKFQKMGNTYTIETTFKSGDIDIFNPYVPANYTDKELSQYTGTYYSKLLDIRYSIKLKDRSLRLYIRDENVAKLNPVSKHLFSSDYGSIKFDLINKNLSISDGRAMNIRFNTL